MRRKDPVSEAARALEQGKDVALCTVVRMKGSGPRHEGTKMAVFADGTISGTIGGSLVEALVIRDAKEAITKGAPTLRSYDLASGKGETSMICGGAMEVFIDPLLPLEPLHIFGGGHVGQALATLAVEVGFRCIVYDDRADWASPERFPPPVELLVDDMEARAHALEPGPKESVVIVTRGHSLDREVLQAVLSKGFRYIGLISSKVKKKRLFTRLLEEGHDPDRLEQVHSPIGLDIGAETPEEIAVAILAELVQVRRRG